MHLGIGKTSQWLRSVVAFSQDASSNPRTHVRQFKTASSYNFRGSQYLSLSAVDNTIHMYMNEINILKYEYISVQGKYSLYFLIRLYIKAIAPSSLSIEEVTLDYAQIQGQWENWRKK